MVDVLVFDTNVSRANRIKTELVDHPRFRLTVVNDDVAARLVAKRVQPSVIVADAADPNTIRDLQSAINTAEVEWVGVGGQIPGGSLSLPQPLDPKALLDTLNRCKSFANQKSNEVYACTP